ncbi:MAG: hypothetical protein GKR91_14955 [Pseudomonadales bacterium]|nr:hypothetical protein [Pseudomonadales bacterium]
MRIKEAIFLILVTGFSTVSWAQLDVVGAVVGTLAGTVQDEDGNLVAPEGSVEAVITASDSSGSLAAHIEGTASSTGALGLGLSFSADFEAATGSFVGMYSDRPGMTPNQEIIFVPTTELSWEAQISGVAPSSTGERSYDLSLGFSIPQAAIYDGSSLPNDSVFTGVLNHTVAATVPLVVPEISLDQELEFNFTVVGSWEITVVPLDDASTTYTGQASGTFSGTAGEVSVTVPLLGDLTLPADFEGAFAGNLYTVSETELAFKGSWTAASGTESFGGNVTITIPLTDFSTFPYQIDGTMPLATGIQLQPTFNLPITLTGSFPLSITGS